MAKKSKLAKAKAILKPVAMPCGDIVFIRLNAFCHEVLNAAKRHKIPCAMCDTDDPSRCKVLLSRALVPFSYPEKYKSFEARLELLLAAILDIRRTEKQGVCNRYRDMIHSQAKTIADLEQHLHNNKHSLERELREGEDLIKAIDFKLLERHAKIQENP